MSVKFTIEISDELNSLLEKVAKEEHRSKNGQVNILLVNALIKPETKLVAYDSDGKLVEVGTIK